MIPSRHLARGSRLAFEPLLPFEAPQLAEQSVPVGPAFIGFGDVTPRGSMEGFGRPEKEVEQFSCFGARFGMHGFRVPAPTSVCDIKPCGRIN